MENVKGDLDDSAQVELNWVSKGVNSCNVKGLYILVLEKKGHFYDFFFGKITIFF